MATATAPKTAPAWEGFKPGLWQNEINVRDFIQQNYDPYDGDESFLAPATARTKNLWARLSELFIEERKKGVLDVSQIPSSITAHAPGYIDKENEIIVGLQTEAPLKRAIMPNGGLRMVLTSLKTYGYEPDPHVVEAFTKYRKTHNEGVFDAYTADVRACRSSHVLTGLPDAYGRGRIIGDYRRGLQVMSGGFTLSGGEPLMQDRFAVRLCMAAKAMGVHTAIETNGYLGDRLSDEELDQIDLVLLGIKAWDPERHRNLTGKDIAPTLDFARRLAARKRPIWVRFVLVPGLTDDQAEIASIATFAGSLGNVQRVEVLPFHQMGRYKWDKLGLDYTLTDAKPPSAELTERVLDQFRSRGLTAY